AVADVDGFLNGIRMKTCVVDHLAKMALTDIAGAVREWIKDRDGVAVSIIPGPCRAHEGGGVGRINPGALQSQVAHRDDAKVISREGFVVIERFRARDERAVLVL